MKVYADNAATTKVSKNAINAMLPYFEDNYGNPSSLHSMGQEAKSVIEDARKKIANIIGCEPREIFFTSGGSESDNQAILSAAAIGKAKGKMHIVSSTIEHHAILHTLNKLEKQGFTITLVDVNKNGLVNTHDVEKAITENTCLVTIMYANNEIGTIQPIKLIGEICRNKGVLFHTDAVQAVGHLDVNVVKDNIDMLSMSAHKFHGPKGIGVLYAKKGIRLTNIIDGGAQERGKRAGTENVAGVVGMLTALVEAVSNIENNNNKMMEQRDKLIKELSKIPHSALNGDQDKRLAGNVNMCFEGIEGESLLLLLDAKGIYASSGSACTSGSLDPSHVLLAIGRPHEVAHGSLRLSLSEYTTDEEIDYMIAVIPEVVSYLRSISPVWDDLQKGKRNYVIQ